MALRAWLQTFSSLHERAKRGELAERDRDTYLQGRDELARAMLAAQRVAVQPGLPPRRALRVARALQADLEFHDGKERVMTQSLSAGGFAALMARPPRPDDEAGVALRLPGGQWVRARGRVLGVRQQAGSAVVDFGLHAIEEGGAEQLESFVFDAVLATLTQA